MEYLVIYLIPKRMNDLEEKLNIMLGENQNLNDLLNQKMVENKELKDQMFNTSIGSVNEINKLKELIHNLE